MAEEADYYSVLEVSPDASAEEIRLAFRRLARLYHPDVAGTGDLGHMQRLNVAYQTLSDPERRRLYDLERGHAGRTAVHTAPSAAAAGTATGATTERPAEARAGSVRHSSGPLQRVASLGSPDRTPITALAFAHAGAVVGLGLIDGRAIIWDVAAGRSVRTLSFASSAPAGVLQELRLSPSGALAVGWGLLLGTRVWRVDLGQPLWTAGANGPSGSMDAVVADAPAQVRLALPDAPLALAEDDPFHWAHVGRFGTAVFTRPLGAGPLDAAWAVPRRCLEVDPSLQRRSPAEQAWRVHQRILSADGRQLLTFSSTSTNRGLRTGMLHVWDLEHRSMLGGATRPNRVARVQCPPGTTFFPLTTTPDLGWVAIGHLERSMHLVAPASRTHRMIATGPLTAEARAALSPDGALLALARGTQLDLWRTTDGAHLQDWQFASEIGALGFTTSGARALLGVGLGNGLAELWG